MELSKLSEPLPIESIEFRIQSINKGGYATILPYKDARVDMQRLDKVCGPLNWQRVHCRDNKNCSVGIYNETTKEWIWKEDTGTESNTEQEKGLASDSFKRACFNWGIGRELYGYPVIQIKLNGSGHSNKDEWYLNEKNKDKYGNPRPTQGFGLKLKDWKWHSIFENGELIYLGSKDTQGNLRFKFDNRKVVTDE